LFEGVIGQELAKGYLARAVTSGRLAHAYLFHGPAGVGKRTLARMFLKAVACVNRTDGACGLCPPCRMFAAGTYPDLCVLSGANRPIGIDQVRQMQRGLRYRPYGTRHLCLIEDAEEMTVEAANTLLKTLEEPEGPALFILTGSRPDRLPPTVVSRCLKIPFRPLTRDEIIAGLENMGFKGDILPVAAALSRGSLGRAAEAAAGREDERRGKAVSLAGALVSGLGTAELCARARELGERTELLALTEWLLLWYRDLLWWRETQNTGLLVYADHLDEVRRQAGRVTTPVLVQAINVIEDVRKKLLANANVRLAAEVLCLRLAELVQGGRA
jgi:DNA polymerase-3 subunit delta'